MGIDTCTINEDQSINLVWMVKGIGKGNSPPNECPTRLNLSMPSAATKLSKKAVKKGKL